jgi:hypothetical protein
MGIRIAPADMLRDLEDFPVKIDRVAMGGQWRLKQKKAWEHQGMTTCQEPLKDTDQMLDKVREATAAEIQLEILESRQDT